MTAQEKPLPFSKVIESEDRPTGAAANSRTFHETYDSTLMARVSDQETWPFDPVGDAEAMRWLHRGLKALYEEALPDPVEAARCFEAAIRQRAQSSGRNDFARAWLNLAAARLSLRELDRAAQILTRLIERVEQGEMRMTPAALSMAHHNRATANWLLSRESQSEARERFLITAAQEYATADQLNGYKNTSDLLDRLVVLLELDRPDERAALLERIRNYMAERGEEAREILREYRAMYPSLHAALTSRES